MSSPNNIPAKVPSGQVAVDPPAKRANIEERPEETGAAGDPLSNEDRDPQSLTKPTRREFLVGKVNMALQQYMEAKQKVSVSNSLKILSWYWRNYLWTSLDHFLDRGTLARRSQLVKYWPP